jgi:hypothetical protein
MPSKTAIRRQQTAKRHLAANPTDWDALQSSIINNSKAARLARILAAQVMGLINDPEGLNLPDDLWKQKLLEAQDILRKMP